ncbi:MAG: hypothetical protein K2L66_01945 [Paramuribaculum sp.]|nr:hypothetical protein [Paramuribaculum sp.]
MLIKHLKRPIKRRWRGRGNGVHSPFAYRFITEVLRQKDAYYAYDQLDGYLPRLAYRVALCVSPQHVTCHTDDPAIVRALQLGHRHGLLNRRPIDADYVELTVKGSSFSADIAAMRGRLDSAGCGMLFEGRRAAIAVCSTILPRTDYLTDT